jgi:hypothetical protein
MDIGFDLHMSPDVALAFVLIPLLIATLLASFWLRAEKRRIASQRRHLEARRATV